MPPPSFIVPHVCSPTNGATASALCALPARVEGDGTKVSALDAEGQLQGGGGHRDGDGGHALGELRATRWLGG